jgi:hypothetical protein
MLAACIPWTTPTRPPPRRSARRLRGCPPVNQCRGLCSTAATTPPSSLWTSLRSPWRCWCGCDRTAASTPTRHLAGPDRHAAHQRRSVRHRDRAGVGGLHPKQQRHPGHGSRGPRPIVRGTIRVQVERVPARTRPPKVLWLWWAGPWIWTWPGARTSAGSTWNTPSASPNRPSGGPPRARARPSRPTAGPGWCWLHTPSCAWPARSPATNGCRGSGPDPSRDCPLPGPPRVSATSGRTRLAGHRAKTCRPLPRPAQGQPIRVRHAVPGHHQARHQAQEEGHRHSQGRLTGPRPAHTTAAEASGQSGTPPG